MIGHAALFLALLACLGGVAAWGEDGNDSASASDPDAGGAFPVTIEHSYGTTVIPEAPERVVTAGFNDADYALAFGIVPVGVRDFIGTFEEESRAGAQEARDGVDPEKVSNPAGELSLEAIAAAQPDLILAYSYLEKEEYETLAAIAPTVVEPSVGSLWADHTRDVGRALGMSDRADELVAEVEGKFAAARGAHPDFVGTTLAIQFAADPSAYYLLEPQDPRSEEHTHELQSLMRNSSAVFCLKKKKQKTKADSPKNTVNLKHIIKINKTLHIKHITEKEI